MAIEGSPRVAFFSWTTALGKILTIDNLRKRHLVILEWCNMCKRCGESIDHLLLHCPFAFEMWSMVFCLLGDAAKGSGFVRLLVLQLQASS